MCVRKPKGNHSALHGSEFGINNTNAWMDPLNVAQWIKAKHLNFGLNCPADTVPEVFFFVQLYKTKLCCHVLFREEAFSWHPLGSYFSNNW